MAAARIGRVLLYRGVMGSARLRGSGELLPPYCRILQVVNQSRAGSGTDSMRHRKEDAMKFCSAAAVLLILCGTSAGDALAQFPPVGAPQGQFLPAGAPQEHFPSASARQSPFPRAA